MFADMFENGEGGPVVGERDDDGLALVQVSVFQDVALGGVSEFSVETREEGFANALLVQVDDGDAESPIQERSSRNLACGAVADNGDIGRECA